MQNLSNASNSDAWEFKFRILCVFKRTHAHCDVPLQTHENSLYAWLEQQYSDYHNGTLLPERADRLRQLGVSFECGPSLSQRRQNALRWQQRVAELIVFKERFGHCNIPARWKENMPLGRWLHVQRAWKRQGILNAERIEELEKIGVTWTRHGITPSEPSELHYKSNDLLWETRFKQLLAWKDKNFCVPRGGQDEPLRRWIGKQRGAYRAGHLSAERLQRLQGIGLPLEAPGQFDDLWEKRFQQLLAYRARFGHCNVPAKWIEDVPFGHWVHIQRAFKRQGKLSAERIHRLEEIGFLWMRDDFKPIRSASQHNKVVDALWEARFNELKRWKKRNFVVPANKQWLHKWMIRQRFAYNAGTLPAERQRRLEEIGFPRKAPSQYTELWEQRFAELLAFQQRFGHCDVPARWHENVPLGRGVSVQRLFRRRGWLSADRIRRLDEVGFSWDRSKAPRLKARSN